MNELICVIIIIGVVGAFWCISKLVSKTRGPIMATIKWNIKRIKWNIEEKKKNKKD